MNEKSFSFLFCLIGNSSVHLKPIHSQHVVLTCIGPNIIFIDIASSAFCVKELGFALTFFRGRQLQVMSVSVSLTTVTAWPDSFEDSR